MQFRAIVTLSSLVLSAAACTTSSAPTAQAHAGRLAPLHAKLVARFDPAQSELPEGLALADDAAFVGFAATSKVVRIDLDRFEARPFGQLPLPVAGKGFMTSLALASNGDVYAGLASFVPEVQAGIYRIPKEGGNAVLFAKDAALPFPNALAFDSAGALFATDSGTGSVFRVDPSGLTERWATHDAITGDKDGCNAAGPGFAIGANGLVIEQDNVFVVNMDKATLVKISRDAAGKSGVPSVVAGPDCDALGGADGLAVAPDGSFVVAVNRQNKVMRVGRDGSIRTLVSGPPLDFPATVAYRKGSLYATNFALKNASAGRPATPGLVQFEE